MSVTEPDTRRPSGPPERPTFASHARRHTARARHHGRRAMPELRTLVKFGVVGGSGFVVNLAVFAIARALGAHHILAATIAFLAAVGNNFHWNRRWTFRAVGAEAIHHQARRFLIVSAAAFGIQLGFLEIFVAAGLTPFTAQAISVILATPFGFVGNRIWTFHEDGGLRVRWGRRRARLRADRG